jgi:4-hydroxy 2-oxovalerate aldolase
VPHGDGPGGSWFGCGFCLAEEMALIRAAAAEASAARTAVLLLPGAGTVADLRRAREAGAPAASRT